MQYQWEGMCPYAKVSQSQHCRRFELAISLLWGHRVYFSMVSSIPGLYTLDTGSIFQL